MIKKFLDINSNDNTLFITGMCNNNCLMCCQPPTIVNDIRRFYDQNIKLIKKAPKNLPIIGISGGEPTLAGKDFFELISVIREELPNTTIHILSNGRTFANEDFVLRLSEYGNNNFLLGIPIHSDNSIIHDKIANSKNAFNETILGLYNLAACNFPIELRIVINKLNYSRLTQLSDYIYKNLSFVRHISFIAMEYIGYARKNQKEIWIEPIEYIPILKDAIFSLANWNMDVSIFNLPLCLLSENLHKFAKQSISDWKTQYLNICTQCNKKNDCCGLFSTSSIKFKGLSPIL